MTEFWLVIVIWGRVTGVHGGPMTLEECKAGMDEVRSVVEEEYHQRPQMQREPHEAIALGCLDARPLSKD
jgi:hypothetical protein